MAAKRQPFQQQAEELVARFDEEVDRREWVRRWYQKRLRDEGRLVNEIPALDLQKAATSLLLDPIGYDVPGAEAAVDLYLLPTYDPTASVYSEDGRWVSHCAFSTDSTETPSTYEVQEVPLSAERVNQVLDSIAHPAVPSV